MWLYFTVYDGMNVLKIVANWIIQLKNSLFVTNVQIVRILEGDVSLDDLKDGIKPGQNVAYNSSSSSDQYDTMQYNADMQKFRKAVFSNSDEFGTSSGSSGEVSQKQQRL